MAGPSATAEQQLAYALQQIAALQTQVTVLTNAGTAAPAVAPSSSMRVPKLSKFRGDKDDASDVESWLYVAEKAFIANNVARDADRISHATALLEKHALAWWRYQEEQVRIGGPALPNTWAAFVAALTKRFKPLNDARIARDRLLTLAQTGSVSQYAALMQQLLIKCPDVSLEERRHRFINGLKPVIRKELLLREPADLDTAMEMAQRLDGIHYQFSSRLPAAAGQSGPTPMEIGATYDEDENDDCEAENLAAVRTPPPRRQPAGTRPTASAPAKTLNKLTPAERRQCMERGVCFRCRQPGHLALDCPKNNTAHPNGGRPPRAGVATLGQE